VWSRARHNISNHIKAREKERVGLEMALFTIKVIQLCRQRGIFWSLENPKSSRLFEFEPMLEVLSHREVCRFDFDMCAYGVPHKKPTTLFTNCQFLCDLQACCPKNHQHVQLRGSARVEVAKNQFKWQNLSTTAGAYPSLLCLKWSDCCAKHFNCVEKAGSIHESDTELQSALRHVAERHETRVKPGQPPAKSDALDSSVSQRCSLAEAYLQRSPWIVFGQHTNEEKAAILARKDKARWRSTNRAG
jgi:hypothetical protein